MLTTLCLFIASAGFIAVAVTATAASLPAAGFSHDAKQVSRTVALLTDESLGVRLYF